ncbi:MAG: antibiotic biosynthesis monooxygenase [Clostridiales bacterium]|nr:antibiotic biosynthesis monooxygenase [Clostridiales bacterium]
MTVAVVCKEKIKEGQKEAFLAHMQEMIRLTHEEDGCIAYNLYEPKNDPDADLVMIEMWENQEALDRHMASEHFQRLVPSGDVYKTEPTVIRIYERL